MKKIGMILLVLSLAGGLPACAARAVNSPFTPTAALTASSTAELTAAPTQRPTRRPVLRKTATLTPTLTPTPVVYPFLAGLRYSASAGDGLIDAGGTPRQLSAEQNGPFTPDGSRWVRWDFDEIDLVNPETQEKTNLTQSPGIPSTFEGWSTDGEWLIYREGAFLTGADLWMVSLETGQRRELTHSVDSDEYLVSVWPGDAHWWVIGVQPLTGEYAFSGMGYLTLLDVQTGLMARVGQQAMTQGDQVAFPPSVEGQAAPDRFFFSENQQIFEYTRAEGPRPFSLPPIVNAEAGEEVGFSAPVCSPDARWMAFQTHQSDGRTGWALADLETWTTRLLHRYTHEGMGAHIDWPAFSPDGRWLLVNAQAQDERQSGLWVYNLQGQPETRLPGYPAVFSPDASHVLARDPTGQDRFVYIAVETWEIAAVVTLPGAVAGLTWGALE